MQMTARQRRRSNLRWLYAAVLVCALTLLTGVIIRPFLPDPMPAGWLAPNSAGAYVRRDSLAYYAYPLVGTGFTAAALALAKYWPSANACLAPLPGRVAFLLAVMCSNVGVLAWFRPTVFNAWLCAVYIALLAGLVFNHAREALELRRRPSLADPAPDLSGKSHA